MNLMRSAGALVAFMWFAGGHGVMLWLDEHRPYRFGVASDRDRPVSRPLVVWAGLALVGFTVFVLWRSLEDHDLHTVSYARLYLMFCAESLGAAATTTASSSTVPAAVIATAPSTTAPPPTTAPAPDQRLLAAARVPQSRLSWVCRTDPGPDGATRRHAVFVRNIGGSGLPDNRAGDQLSYRHPVPALPRRSDQDAVAGRPDPDAAGDL